MTETLVLHAAEETLEAVHTRRHTAYPAYKPSGVEWLGDVPEHWDVKRLKFLSRINPGASEVMGLRGEDEVSFVPMDAVGEYGGMRLNTDKRLDEVRSGFTYFRDEDVVIAKITPCFENGKGGIARHLTNGVAFGTTELHVVRTGPKLGAGFLFYLTISDAFRRLGASEMYGAGGQKRVPTDFVRDFPVGVPPLEEQQAIARFLDEQTRKIDDLIEAKRSLLDLLKEKRQAVITHAVTRGLDPAAKLKPSGVEWLGDVPEHWDVKRLRFLSCINPSASEISDLRDEDKVSFVMMDAVGEYGGLRLDAEKSLDEVRSNFTYFCDGDVVVAKITPCFENGKGSIAEHLTNGVAFGTTELHVVRPGPSLDQRFFFYLTISDAFRKLGEAEMYGAGGQKRVPINFVLDFPVSLPELKEQREIARFLDEETEKMDDLESVVREAIETLESLRAGIISAAVTGKIDVREEGV